MICTKCKAELPEGYRFCYKCGTVYTFTGETQEESVRLAEEQHQMYMAYVQAQKQAREAQEALLHATAAPQRAVPAPQPAPQPAREPVQQPVQQSQHAATTSAAAITALVLGLVALGTSFLPIVNNASFFMGALGLAFAVAGMVATKKGKPKRGRGLAVASLTVNVLAIVIVIATQSMFSAALKSMTEGPGPLTQGEQADSVPGYYDVSIVGAETVDDGHGGTALVVAFEYANNTSTPVSFLQAVPTAAAQDGVAIGQDIYVSGYTGSDGMTPDYMLKVEPGGSTTVHMAFALTSGNEVTVRCQLGFVDGKYPDVGKVLLETKIRP